MYVHCTSHFGFDLGLGLDWDLELRLVRGVSVAVPCVDLPRLYQSQACDGQKGIEERRGEGSGRISATHSLLHTSRGLISLSSGPGPLSAPIIMSVSGHRD